MAEFAIQSGLPEAVFGALPLRGTTERPPSEGLTGFAPSLRPDREKTDPTAARPLPVFDREREFTQAPEVEAIEPERKDLKFRIIDRPRAIQAQIVDQETNEIIRETPTTPRLRFARAFRESLAATLGHRLDVSA